MLVKVIEKYKDLEIGDIVPAGVILEVSEARADVLKSKGKAVDFEIPATKPEKKSKQKEPEVEVKPEPDAEEEPKVEEPEVETAPEEEVKPEVQE